MQKTTADIENAKIAIASRGAGDPAELLALSRRLTDDNQIGWARRVLEAATECAAAAPASVRLAIRIDLAFCTYKDPDLPLDDRLRRALGMIEAVLEDCPGLPDAMRQQALGIAGAIQKRRWWVYGLRTALEASRASYVAAYELGPELDGGHTAINAAFALDLVADQHRNPDGSPTAAARGLQEKAEAIREHSIRVLTAGGEARQGPFWHAMTLAEAWLGTGRYDEAREWAARAAALEVQSWQMETAARQLVQMARLQARKEGCADAQTQDSQAWSVVRELLGGDTAAALSFFRGKAGLALSGGGFRASLYHIGVLAKLAELDMLRHIEVISCVSGGSILGAYYYLELKHLLESKPDDAITRDDYIELVRRIERNFVTGVQRNIRTRMLGEFGSNLKTLLSRHPAVSERLGELYERELYSRVADGARGPRYLADLLIRPQGAPEGFRPKYDNWRSLNKVPILVLNATTLNTCHNWQFTATFMGEPPARAIEGAVDGNDRFRRMYHEDAPPGYQKLRLGSAVAASACVPGLFDPLFFDGLYEGYVARLVDGGVYDNQGVASLLEQDCTVLLVSDAAGQTGVQKDPPDNRLTAVSRANSILMARVREAEFQLLAHLRDSSVLSGLMYVHLKKDLNGRPLDWTGCPDPSDSPSQAVLTCYGIRKDVQRLIAGIRTDLDSFSDAEADALMLSGYAMTGSEFPHSVEGFPVPADPTVWWRFRDMQRIAGNPVVRPELAELKEALSVAECQAFKAWKISPVLRAVRNAAAAVLFIAAVSVCRVFWQRSLVRGAFDFDLTGKDAAVLALAAGAVVFAKARVLPKWLRYRNHFSQCLLSLGACTVGWILLQAHLRLIDPMWIRSGPRYRKAVKPADAQPSAGAASTGS